MQSEEKFRQIQKRAYEIYLQRDPHSATPEDDWLAAEAQIAREQRVPSVHTGPARFKDPSRWGEIGTHLGEDIENPA